MKQSGAKVTDMRPKVGLTRLRRGLERPLLCGPGEVLASSSWAGRLRRRSRTEGPMADYKA